MEYRQLHRWDVNPRRAAAIQASLRDQLRFRRDRRRPRLVAGADVSYDKRSDRIHAAVVALGMFLLLWMAEVLGVLLPSPFAEFAIAVSLDTRLAPFVTGAVYVSDFGFFLCVCLLGILFSVAALARR